MNYTGSHTDEFEEGDVTEPFEHVTYASFRYSKAVDPSEVTATVERNVLDGSVDPDAIVPTHSSIRAAMPAPVPVETPAPAPVVGSPARAADVVAEAEEVVAADDLVIEDDVAKNDVIEMESIATRSGTAPASRPSAPPPLPARASRASLPPASVRAEDPPSTVRVPSAPAAIAAPPVDVAASPGLFAIEIVPLPLAPAGPPAPVIDVRAVPPPPPAVPPIEAAPFAVASPAFSPMAAAPSSAFPPPSFPLNDTPSTAPVAMSLSAGLTGGYEAVARRRVRLSPAALAALITLVGSSVLAFGTVLALRFARPAAAPELASTESVPPEASPAAELPPSAPEALPKATQSAVPTIAPAALPSVVASVAVESLPKIAVDPAMTLVSTRAAAKGHRVFVDGRVVGTAGGSLQVKCGDHSVKVGSAAKARTMHFPCGGEVSVD